VRYWPEECSGKEYGKTKVHNLSESSTADYTLREFLVSREGSSEGERKVYHYHFQVTEHTMVKLFYSAYYVSKNSSVLFLGGCWGIFFLSVILCTHICRIFKGGGINMSKNVSSIKVTDMFIFLTSIVISPI
jgi:hypothetical protein